MCGHNELMKKKVADAGGGDNGSDRALLMARQGKSLLTSLHLWPEGAVRGGPRRFGVAGITIAGLCLCLYVLLLIFTSQDPAQWPSLNLCKTRPQAAAKQRILPIHVAGASSASPSSATNISHIVFGVSASSRFWETRKEYIKLWWKPNTMRGFVWLEAEVNYTNWDVKTLPPQKISSDTTKFKYTNKLGLKTAIRISRVVSDTYRLGLPNVRWFVMGDDDTIFIPENLVKVLSKYDHTQFYYIGANSESHTQNLAFSYNMAFGGGGFAISSPLAKTLYRVQDGCLKRYPSLFGSDDRIHACMAELGVPLTKEAGFHQFDIRGNAFGMMTAHPLAPAVSLHHMDNLEPVFPNKTKLGSLKHLKQSMEKDPTYFLQQSICYDKKRSWSISVSWGYAVQIFRDIVPARELVTPLRTFYNWNKRADYTLFSFNSRAFPRHPCQRPLVFYLQNMSSPSKETPDLVESIYVKDNASISQCHWKDSSLSSIDDIRVIRLKDEDMWSKVARRKCCHLGSRSSRSSRLQIRVRDCNVDEVAAAI